MPAVEQFWISSGASWAHSTQGDITPDSVTLGADLSIGGSGEEVSSRTEVVLTALSGPRKRWAYSGDLTRCSTRSRLRVGGANFSSVVQTLVSPMLR
jgi:hypothetical protein